MRPSTTTHGWSRSLPSREAVPHTAAWEEEEEVRDELWREAARHGMIGFEVPNEFGGLGPNNFCVQHGDRRAGRVHLCRKSQLILELISPMDRLDRARSGRGRAGGAWSPDRRGCPSSLAGEARRARRSSIRIPPGPRTCSGCWSSDASGGRRDPSGSGRRSRTRGCRRGARARGSRRQCRGRGPGGCRRVACE